MKWHKLITVMIVGVGLLGSAMVHSAMAQAGGLRGEVPGSLLIFPEFNISAPAVTQLRISDVQNPALGGTTRVKLNYVCPPLGGPGAVGGLGSVCNEIDRHKFLTFHGTLVIDVATDLGFPGTPSAAPCNKGFVVAIVEDAAHHAISANQLIGSYRISGTDGDDAEAVQAIAVQSPQSAPPGSPPVQLGTIDGTGELVLSFGVLATNDYVSLPYILYSDFQAVDVAAGKRTDLILLTMDVKSGLANPQAQVSLKWWNAFEDEFSATLRFTCWAEWGLETISGSFLAANLGSPYGSFQAKAITAGGYSPTLLGVIRETGPGPTLRRLYHVGLRSTTYAPDPDTAPPGP